MNDWEADARAALRRSAADARRRADAERRSRRPAAARAGRGAGRRRHATKRRPWASTSASPAMTVSDPFFGGEGPDRTGCRQCGRCMVGCPHGSKNTLVKNYLYLAEKRGARVMPERTVVDVRPLGDGSGEQGYEVEWCARARGCARTAASSARGEWSSRRAAGHEQAAAALPSEWLARKDLIAVGRAGAHEQRVDPDRDRARGLPGGSDQTRGDHLLDLPGPEHAHRDRHLRRRRRLDAPPVHAAGRRRHARDAPAEAAHADPAAPQALRAGAVPQALVAAHDHRAGDADARQRDRAAPASGPVRLVLAEDRAGPRATDPDVHPDRQPGRRMARPAHRRRRPELASPRRCSTSPRPPTSSAAR